MVRRLILRRHRPLVLHLGLLVLHLVLLVPVLEEPVEGHLDGPRALAPAIAPARARPGHRISHKFNQLTVMTQ